MIAPALKPGWPQAGALALSAGFPTREKLAYLPGCAAKGALMPRNAPMGRAFLLALGAHRKLSAALPAAPRLCSAPGFSADAQRRLPASRLRTHHPPWLSGMMPRRANGPKKPTAIVPGTESPSSFHAAPCGQTAFAVLAQQSLHSLARALLDVDPRITRLPEEHIGFGSGKNGMKP